MSGSRQLGYARAHTLKQKQTQTPKQTSAASCSSESDLPPPLPAKIIYLKLWPAEDSSERNHLNLH